LLHRAELKLRFLLMMSLKFEFVDLISKEKIKRKGIENSKEKGKNKAVEISLSLGQLVHQA
jgi:hypothetical protein